jgi:hypothetical protein
MSFANIENRLQMLIMSQQMNRESKGDQRDLPSKENAFVAGAPLGAGSY